MSGNSGEECNDVDFRNADCIVYDDEDCGLEHWSNPIGLLSGESRSFSLFKSLTNYRYKNTIESISVRSGCTLEAFDDSDFTDDGQMFTAPDDADLHITLDRSLFTWSLDDDIESIRCYCQR